MREDNLYWVENINTNGCVCILVYTNSLFDSVVAVAFQITFRVEMHANNIFLFFKNYFWHQHIKTIQIIQNILNFNQKKLNFLGTKPRSQTVSKYVNNDFISYMFFLKSACEF